MSAPTQDYVAAARAAFDLTSFTRVVERAAANGHLTEELRGQLAPIGEAIAVADPTPSTDAHARPRCTGCGHVHAGEQLGGICIGCPCEVTR